MLNTVCAEIMKLKKNKMALTALLIVFAVPIFLILKSLFIDRVRGNYSDWLKTAEMLIGIILPLMSGLVITGLIHKEYADGTLRTTLAAPTYKLHFVLAKLAVWFIWYIVTLFLLVVIVIIGYYFLFQDEFLLSGCLFTIKVIVQMSLFSFISCIPLLWVSFRQHKLFYPSMLVNFGFVVLQMAGRQVSEEMLFLAIIVPWTAVSVSGMIDSHNSMFLICVISIMFCGIFGIILAIRNFCNQDQ